MQISVKGATGKESVAQRTTDRFCCGVSETELGGGSTEAARMSESTCQPDLSWESKPKSTCVEEDSTRTAAIQAGQVNAIAGIPPLSQDQFENDPRFEVIEVQKNGQPGGLTFDTTSNSPVGEVEVRRAISYAIDRSALNHAIYQGKHTEAFQLLEERMGDWNDPDVRFPEFDADEARRILDAAGWVASSQGIREKDGEPLTFTATTSTAMERTMTLIQAQLREVGMDLIVDVVAPAEVTSVMNSPSPYDLAWGNPLGWTNGMPDLLYSLYNSRFIPPDGGSNETKTNIPEVDELTDAAVGSNDDALRRENFYRVQELVTDNVSYLPLLSFNANWAVAEGINGLVPERRGTYMYFHSAWMTEELQASWPAG